MRRSAMVLTLALLATGCRAGFPSLSEAPDAPPERLVAAQAAATADRARMETLAQDQARHVGQRAPAPPAKLLAALPADRPAPAGVIDRAALEARTSGRRVQIVGVGPGGLAAANRAAALFRARGVEPYVGEFRVESAAAARVELYLLP